MRRTILLGACVVLGVVGWWWWAESQAAGQKEVLRLDVMPLAYSLTPEALVWVERRPDDPRRTSLRRYDIATRQQQSLYDGTFLRFVKQLGDGRTLVVEAGEPETPPGGLTAFPQARILLHEGGKLRSLVEPAPHCVEASLAGERVFWISVPPCDGQRFPYLPGWGQAELFVSEQGDTRRLTTLEAWGGRWQGKLLGVVGDHLYVVEYTGLGTERPYSRLLRVRIERGEREVLVTRQGKWDWLLAEGAVYGVVGSPESQNPLIHLAVLRWTPQEGLQWLTDWLSPSGKLAYAGGRAFYAELSGLWEIPEHLDLARKRAGRLGVPFDVALTPQGAWVFTLAFDSQSKPKGCRLIFRRFGEEMGFSKETKL